MFGITNTPTTTTILLLLQYYNTANSILVQQISLFLSIPTQHHSSDGDGGLLDQQLLATGGRRDLRKRDLCIVGGEGK